MSLAPASFCQVGNAAFAHMEKFDRGIAQITQKHRDQVIDNVFRFIQDHDQGKFYSNFFDEIVNILGSVQVVQHHHQLRLSNIIRMKLAGTYKNKNSLGGWLGGASEILDTVRSLTRQGAIPVRVSVPNADKMFDPDDYLHPMGSMPQALSQDIDRTEVHGNTKYYVEVKADAETAVNKVNSKGVSQLEGIRAVIHNRIARHHNGQTDHSNQDNRRLEPAVAITNPVGWLTLLTSGVIKLYYTRGFHLMIDGQIITPANLVLLHENLWKLLHLPGQPLNFYELRRKENEITRDTLRIFNAHAKLFPRPHIVVMRNYVLTGFGLPGAADLPGATERMIKRHTSLIAASNSVKIANNGSLTQSAIRPGSVAALRQRFTSGK